MSIGPCLNKDSALAVNCHTSLCIHSHPKGKGKGKEALNCDTYFPCFKEVDVLIDHLSIITLRKQLTTALTHNTPVSMQNQFTSERQACIATTVSRELSNFEPSRGIRRFRRFVMIWKHFCLILFTGNRIRIDSVMRPRSSSRGRNTSASVTVTVLLRKWAEPRNVVFSAEIVQFLKKYFV